MSRIEEACGKGETEKDFIVILKYAKTGEAIRKILGKCSVERTLSGVLTQCRYRDKEISIFRTGKLIMKGLKEKREAEEVLEELLTP